ncbi:MAG: fibronectin type III domain-containing protein [Anaerolineaceae bacterium]|nr:fibronectin type III domain-containing protein [Anaerolineaceae bacterium]
MKNKLLATFMILILAMLTLQDSIHVAAAWAPTSTDASSYPLPLPDDAPPEQSKSGPTPPAEVIERDIQTAQTQRDVSITETVLSVPAYLWRHGCGPTALGMVIGFYDQNGFGDLVPGDASSQTTAVSQMIASGGSSGSPNPPGLEGHFEDYASPVDSYPTLQTDAYITAGRSPHPSDSLADFMDTSKSTRSNYYGWSWSSDMGPAFQDYVSLINSAYQTSYQLYRTSTNAMTASVLINEINANRPMVFLVDSDGNGGTDHFITIIGYRYAPNLQYAAWDTWSNSTIRWEDFNGMQAGVPWGIWGGWSFEIESFTPSAPINVSATDGLLQNRIRISWDAVPNADNYEVYRCTDDTSASYGTSLASPTGRSYDDLTALPDVIYYYRVIACNATQGCSDFSAYDTGYYDSEYQGSESFIPLILR